MASNVVQMQICNAVSSELLTEEEELLYCRSIQAMVSIKAVQTNLAKEFNREPTISEIASKINATEESVQRTMQMGEHARQRVIESNLRLAISIAKKYLYRGVAFEDLIQEGNLGLEIAAGKFDPTRGYKFSTYATFWIKQRIRRAIAEQSRTVRLPIHITEKLNKIKKAQRQLSQELGRRPTIAEVEARLAWKPGKVTHVLLFTQAPASLDHLVGSNGDDKDTALGELLPSSFGDPITTESDRERRILLQSAMERLLTDQECELLDRAFGLSCRKQKHEEISRHMNLTYNQVRLLKAKALRKLRVRDPRLRDLL